MISRPLRIVHGKSPLRPAVAWLVPGADPGGWLEELLRWGVPHASMLLRVLPHSRGDPRPRGILVTAAAAPKVSVRCPGYGRLAGRLFLPVEARLDPDVAEEELAALLGSGEYVLHPAVGLVGFEAGDLLRVVDLLRMSAPADGTWDGARPGVAFAQRLTSLVPEEMPTADVVLREGRGDIGAASDSMDELPPVPGEPSSNPLRRAGQAARRSFARVLKWFTEKAPAGASAPTWVDRLRDWAERQLGPVSDALTARRNRELQRLMQMLESDPDQGLRYALPFGGGGHRGIASPGDQLGRREVNFDLGRVGSGGRPADFWDVPSDCQNRLIVRYRQLADREVRLGRHRRAAYIYAELLNDLAAAATALTAGGHWREAAVLYRQRLNRPWEAARCLEQGGLWAEAMLLYEDLKAYEKAGDLYTRLEQNENAAEMYRKAVTGLRAGGNFLATARVLEEKLHATDEALAELTAGWPASAQAGECLRGTFRLLGRLGRHDEARKRVVSLAREAVPLGSVARLVAVLADTATGYPDRGTCVVAADCTRVLAARLVPAASISDARQILAAVGGLEPQDRLLGRDCQRYLQERPAQTKPAVPRRVGRRNSPTLVGRVELPRNVAWREATVSGDTIYAAGFRGTAVVLIRCRADGAVQEADGGPWHVAPPLAELPILLSAPLARFDHVLVHVPGKLSAWPNWTFASTDAFPDAVRAGPGSGLSSATLAVERSPQGLTWLLEWRNDMLTLIGLGPHDDPLTTCAVAFRAEWQGDSPGRWLPLHARAASIYVGFGDRLLIFNLGSDKPETVEIGHNITALRGAAPGTRARVAITFSEGGFLYWGDFSHRGALDPFATGMTFPVANFTAAGDLVAADKEGCEVYATQDRQLKLKAELSGLPSRPLAVLPLPKPDQFGLFLECGEVAVYQVPPA